MKQLATSSKRDFYPDLPKLTQQLEWLNALESGDHTRIAAVRNLIASSVRRADAFVGRTPATAAGSKRRLWCSQQEAQGAYFLTCSRRWWPVHPLLRWMTMMIPNL